MMPVFKMADIRTDLEKALAQRDALVGALQRIADMDPFGVRADDLGRASSIARRALGSDPLQDRA